MDKPLLADRMLDNRDLRDRARIEMADAKSRHPQWGPSPVYAGRNPRMR